MRKQPIKLTDGQINDIVSLYVNDKKSARSIAKLFKCDAKTITSILRKNNISIIHRPSKIAQLPEQEILQNYHSKLFSITDLANKYNTSRAMIYKILSQHNIQHTANFDLLSKYTLNKLYFDNIDTEDKAYFLGLLYADGNNYTKNGRIAISLQEEDKYILESFNKAVKSNRGLTLRERNSKNNKHKNQYRLDIVNRYMSEQLDKLGCVNAKSLTLRFPTEQQVPTYLLRHFIRGLWDGDGCISVLTSDTYKRHFRSSITSTLNVCQNIQYILLNTFNINSSIRDYSCNNITKNLNISGFINNSIFLSWLYQDCNFYLERKMQKYLLGIKEAEKIGKDYSNTINLEVLAFRPSTAWAFNTSRTSN